MNYKKEFQKIPHLIRTDYYDNKELVSLLQDFWFFYTEHRQDRYGENGIMPYGYMGKITSISDLRSVFNKPLRKQYNIDTESMAQDIEYLLSFVKKDI